MKITQNALAYIMRKKKRTAILILILTLVLSGLYSCLRIEEASSLTSQKLTQDTNTSLSINSDNPNGFLLKEGEKIKTIAEIKDYLPEYVTLAKAFNLEVVSNDKQIKNDKLPNDYQNLLEVKALERSSIDEFFRSGNYKLVKGKHLQDNDNELSALIHQDLANKNKLSIGQEIEISFFDEVNGKPLKKKCIFKISGIFKGLKQEKNTGLSSDLSSNQIYVRYRGYLKANQISEEEAKVTKITLLTKDIKNKEIVKNKIEKLNLKHLSLTSSNEFGGIAEASKSLKSLMTILTYALIVSASCVLILILILWLRERLYEIGIYLAIGRKKGEILYQLLLEVIFLSLPSGLLAFFIGNILSRQALKQLVNNEDLSLAVASLNLANSKLYLSFFKSYLLLTIIIIISVSLATSLILRKKPRAILAQIN